VGRNYLKNFVRVNVKEPDPLGYIRTIDSITLHTLPMPDLILPGSPYKEGHLCLNFEIHAKSFLWNQIRILMQTFVSYA